MDMAAWTPMEFEFQRFWLPHTQSRSAVLRLLTDAAEYGGWELDRLRLFPTVAAASYSVAASSRRTHPVSGHRFPAWSHPGTR
jgi:hypothetical protein